MQIIVPFIEHTKCCWRWQDSKFSMQIRPLMSLLIASALSQWQWMSEICRNPNFKDFSIYFGTMCGMQPTTPNFRLVPVSCKGPPEVPSEDLSESPSHRRFGMGAPMDLRWTFLTTDADVEKIWIELLYAQNQHRHYEFSEIYKK